MNFIVDTTTDCVVKSSIAARVHEEERVQERRLQPETTVEGGGNHRGPKATRGVPRP